MLINENEMETPRLEFRWVPSDKHGWTLECIYYLVLRLGKYDIRREDESGEPVRDEKKVELGRTCVDGITTPIRKIPDLHGQNEDIDIPFRDGAHAQWDSEQLGNLPIYSVAMDNGYWVAYKVTGD